MNIFVTSDTHRHVKRAEKMYRLLSGEITPEDGVSKPATYDFDLIVHCGDLKADAFRIHEDLGLDVACVFGNCDHAEARGSNGHDIDKIKTPAGAIMITHGDLENVNSGLTDLLYLAEQEGCNAVCYGHTHIPVFREEDGITVVNPGSPVRPLDGTDFGSCAVLVADENGYSGDIYYFEDYFPKRCEELRAKRAAKTKSDASHTEKANNDTRHRDAKDAVNSRTPEKSGPADESKDHDKTRKKTGFLRRLFNFSDGQ